MKLNVNRHRIAVRINWKYIAIGLAVLPFAAVFVAWLGFFNIGAASGHWRITELFLQLAMRSAVRTYAIGIEEPEAFDRGAILPAAGHFARGCATCHGAPGEPRPAMVKAMLPRPPRLERAVHAWDDAQLFRIVKRGIRFTGMPAWPTQMRDDEVWGMVAFLRRLPDLDPEEYRNLAYGPAKRSRASGFNGSFDAALAGCARCHGMDGLGRSAFVPVIAGQHRAYFVESLRAYAAGERASGIMELAATEADRKLWQRLAEYYASLPATEDEQSAADAERIARGRRIAQYGVPRRDIPACLGCHGRPDRNPVYPQLDGQKRPYLENQLRLFAEGERGGTDYAHLMTEFASRLERKEIESLAAYFASRQVQRGKAE
ncbi:c-type cytochrome [Chelativorans alearense]|uniref:c-type cytochrome n=1 Tax=Chelativorans alearense TaxID=2681495 RepID=UPI0013D6ED04|nr:c-type cytochrome [Chelativorans alearense]